MQNLGAFFVFSFARREVEPVSSSKCQGEPLSDGVKQKHGSERNTQNMGSKLYVGNLDSQTTSQDLADLFAGAGEVRRAQVITDRETRQSKGFAFVDMGTDAEALRAISLYNGHVLQDRSLVVNEARPREERGVAPGISGRPNMANRPKFREVKHKVRGGRKARRF